MKEILTCQHYLWEINIGILLLGMITVRLRLEPSRQQIFTGEPSRTAIESNRAMSRCSARDGLRLGSTRLGLSHHIHVISLFYV